MESSDHIPYITPTSKLTSVNVLNVTASKEDALFTYLNTPEPSPKRIAESINLPTTTSLLVEHPTNDIDLELSTHSDQIPTHTSLEMIPNALDNKDVEIDTENANLYLSNETQILNSEYLTKPTTDAIQNGIFLFVYVSNFYYIVLYIFLYYRTQNRRTFEYFLSSI